MSEITELPVEFLFTMHLDLDTPVLMPAGPHGTRVFVTVLNGTVAGPRISGTVVPSSGADWVTVRADGYSQLDVRLLITTDDGAVISMQYGGILDTGPDRRPRPPRCSRPRTSATPGSTTSRASRSAPLAATRSPTRSTRSHDRRRPRGRRSHRTTNVLTIS